MESDLGQSCGRTDSIIKIFMSAKYRDDTIYCNDDISWTGREA